MSQKVQQGDTFESITATIPDGATQSGAIDMRGTAIFGVLLPSGFSGTQLTFQMSNDGGDTWVDVYEKDGTQFALTVAASRYVIVPVSDFPGAVTMRVLTNSAPSGDDEDVIIYTRTIG